MIDITDKAKCCGCGACVQICPKQCISFIPDKEGFDCPVVDVSRCIGCEMCERVCPELNISQPRLPQATYAAINRNETVRRESSSGGVFTLLAETVIARGGVVFGARFDSDWTVRHDKAETSEELAAFRGSKYLQSRIGETFIEAKSHLSEGREVLFSGTPCQIAGLKGYLNKEYANLLTVDFVCHGVPSQGAWKKYLEEKSRALSAPAGKNTDSISLKAGSPWKSISFRDKRLGWKKYGFHLSETALQGGRNTDFTSLNNADKCIYEPFTENDYMRVFLSDLDLRPSCYKCPSKGGRSGSDITLGDFWGIEYVDRSMDDDCGTSLVLINTPKGAKLYRELTLESMRESYEDALRYNRSIEISVVKPPYRELFMSSLEKCGFEIAYNRVFSQSLPAKIRRRLWLKMNK